MRSENLPALSETAESSVAPSPISGQHNGSTEQSDCYDQRAGLKKIVATFAKRAAAAS